MEKKQNPKPYKTMIEALYVPPFEEPEFGPSMVEPCHNLSIQEILADFSRGIVHTERSGMYDDGDDIPENLCEFDDLTDLQIASPKSARDAGKPSDTTDGERSDKEVSKEGSGAEAEPEAE